MLDRFRKKPDPAIQGQIDSVLEEMRQYGPHSPEYPALMEHLERLEKLKAKNTPEPISREAMFMGGIQLVIVLVTLNYEKTGVITTRVREMLRPLAK